MDVQTKIIRSISAVLAGFLVARAISIGWKAVTGERPPDDPEDPEVGLVKAVTFAALSGVLVGVARVFASRAGTKYITRFLNKEV